MAVIPSESMPAGGWSGNVGISSGIPTDYTQAYDVTQPMSGYSGDLADPTGVADSSPAIQYAATNCPNGQFVYIPTGTYLLESSIIRTAADNDQYSILIKGDGPSLTKIRFNGSTGLSVFAFQAAYGWSARTMAISSGNSRGSTELTLGSIDEFMTVGNPMIVRRLNIESGALNAPAEIPGNPFYYMIDCCSQIVVIDSIVGNVVTFHPPLNEAYASDYVSIGIGMPFRCGIQDMRIENVYGDQGSNNVYFYLGLECWVKNVESVMASHWHIQLQTCVNCEIRECVIHEGWNGGGGSIYGCGLFNCCSNNLIENNIAYLVRHAQVLEYGGQGNVFGYNYSFDAINENQLLTDYLMGDQITHGGEPRFNLFEGNVSGTIKFDCVLGGAKYNTVHRSQISRKGLPPVYVACFAADIQWWNTYHNLSGCCFEAPPGGYSGPTYRYGTNQDPGPTPPAAISNATNANPIVITYDGRGGQSGYQTGNFVTISGVIGNTAANVTNAVTTRIDATHFSVPVAGNGPYIAGGSAVNGIDVQAEATTNIDGVFDIVTGITTWAGSDHELPDSYYLAVKPSWWTIPAWPSIGPDLSDKFGVNPAYLRQNGETIPTVEYRIPYPTRHF